MGLLQFDDSGNSKEGGRDGKMARADERERGRTWQENEAQRECLVATAADVVCESSHNVALDSQNHQKRIRLWPWAEAVDGKIVVMIR